MKRKGILLAFAVMAFMLLINGCSKQDVSSESQYVPAQAGAPEASNQLPAVTTTVAQRQGIPAGADKVLLFDLFHKEIFNPDDQKLLGYSEASGEFKRNGYAVRTNNTTLTEETLKAIDAVIIAGPMEPFNEQEIDVLANYVNNGGDVVITLHIADVCGFLANRFGLQMSGSPVAQTHDTFEGSPKNLIANSISGDPLTVGVSSVAVRKSWALRPINNSNNVKVVVSTAADSWVDVNPDDQYNAREPVASYGIVASVTMGKGKVVVIGDDAVFTNNTINMASNRMLLQNIIKWFGEPKK